MEKNIQVNKDSGYDSERRKSGNIIGWIGTGVMGIPMAEHLLNSGYEILVFSRTRTKADELVKKGAQWCDSPCELARKSDYVFTMVGYPSDVEEVYFGESGILKGIRDSSDKRGNRRKKIIIDMTTTRPFLAEKIAEALLPYDAVFFDAPVSGGDVGARNATLSIMVGGDSNYYSDVFPLFSILGKNIVYQGTAGKGQHTKMCNQITIAGTMIGVCESLLYGYKAGLDPEKMLQSITKGAAGCWTLDNLAPRILNNNFAPGFFVEHFVKDMEIALDESRRMELALPGLALVHQLYVALKAQGEAKSGTQALYNALKRINNVK